MSESTILTEDETAEKLGIRLEAVREWLMVGRLKGQLINGTWWIRADDLEAFIEDQEGATSEEAT